MDSNLVQLIKISSDIKKQILDSKCLESLDSLLEYVSYISINNATVHVYADKHCHAAADHLYEELVVRFKSGAAFNRQDRDAICSYNYSNYSAQRFSKLLESKRIDRNKDLIVLFMAENSPDNQEVLKSACALGISIFMIGSSELSDIASLARWQFLVPTQDLSIIYHFQSIALHVLCERLEPEFDNSMHGFAAVLLSSVKLSDKVISDQKVLATYSKICSLFSPDQGSAVFFAGNGGSACDISSLLSQQNIIQKNLLYSLHSTGALLAAYNDGYQPFARQVQACAKSGDLLIVYSTSGNSENLIDAVKEAKNKGIVCIGLLGKDGGKLFNLCDYSIVVPTNETARIQETHSLIATALFNI